jgi:type 1 glutamine amidotransferase
VSRIRAVILSGGRAPFVDPWHPFEATSRELEALVSEFGYDVELTLDPLARLADLDGVDLLIANVPAPAEVDARQLAAARAGLARYLARPVGVAALHVSVTTLFGLPEWTELIGARWVAATMHPPAGPAVVRLVGAHPIASATVADVGATFDLVDERYSRLQFDAEVQPIVVHDFEGAEHPLVWAREIGAVRVVADALGHGVESYQSAGHRSVLAHALRWATDRVAARPDHVPDQTKEY